MSDLKLQGFAVRAEERMPLPDFAELERRGEGSAAAGSPLRPVPQSPACSRSSASWCCGTTRPRPWNPSGRRTTRQVQALEYPGPVMEDLDPGTYELTPSSDPDFPRARISLASGWNAWEGPNRFDGQAPRQQRGGDSGKPRGTSACWS